MRTRRLSRVTCRRRAQLRETRCGLGATGVAEAANALFGT